MTFKEYYLDKHEDGVYVRAREEKVLLYNDWGAGGEDLHEVMKRVFDTLSEYLDETNT